MKFILSARPPFFLSPIIKSHGWIKLAPFGEDVRTDGLTYIDRLTSGRVVALLIQEVTGGVSVEVDGQLSQAERDEIAGKVNWMLCLEQDFSAFLRPGA